MKKKKKKKAQNSHKLFKQQKQLSNVSHQLSLDGEDSVSGCLAVGLLACDYDCLRDTVLCWQVDLGVGLFTDLVALITRLSNLKHHVTYSVFFHLMNWLKNLLEFSKR